MLIVEGVIAVALVAVLIGGMIFLKGVSKKPIPTSNDLSEAVKAYEEATRELISILKVLRREVAVLGQMSGEMSSSLILSTWKGGLLTEEDKHEFHIEQDLKRRREESESQ